MNQFLRKDHFTKCGDEFDYVACFDENGSSSELKTIYKEIENNLNCESPRRFFTLTCCLFSKSEYEKARTVIKDLKEKYWDCTNTLVVLHSHEIVRRNGVYAQLGLDKYTSLLNDIGVALDALSFRIISVTFDLYSYAKQDYSFDPYEVAFDIILNAIHKNTPKESKIALMFESRGKKEDAQLAEHVDRIINHKGTKLSRKIHLKSKFTGLFFNYKYSKDKTEVYHGLEITDLSSSAIHRYMKSTKQGRDFKIVVKKIIGYSDSKFSKDPHLIPCLRHFPKEWDK